MAASVEILWLPLGAGGHSVRYNGRVYEWLVSRLEHRAACDLYHAGLEVWLGADRHAIEVGPVWPAPPTSRGSVGEGPVGAVVLGHVSWFRYEVRCWHGGVIPDAEFASARQRRPVSPELAERLLAAVGQVPRLTWGRDELGVGDMWNSNSVVAWILTASGVGTDWTHVPAGGRAPGWAAGLASAPRLLAAGPG